eukprot:5530959-Alexandrium_andersonii.AAC.1
MFLAEAGFSVLALRQRPISAWRRGREALRPEGAIPEMSAEEYPAGILNWISRPLSLATLEA